MLRKMKPLFDRALAAMEVALDEPTATHVDAARATADLAFEQVSASSLPRGEARQILLLASRLRAMLMVVDRRASVVQRALRLN